MYGNNRLFENIFARAGKSSLVFSWLKFLFEIFVVDRIGRVLVSVVYWLFGGVGYF